MREIKLTKGQTTRVSDELYDALSSNKWCAWWNPCTESYYAVRRGRDQNGKVTTVLMHRQILGLIKGDKRTGDHIDGDTLNNTVENLRIATPAQNTQNQGIRSSNTSGFKGVSRFRNQWAAEITVNKKKIHLGCRDTPEAAHRELYVPAAIKYHGEFARLQ